MGEWIKRNPVAYALINFALCILFAVGLLKMYVDYRVDKRIMIIEEKLDKIEQGQDTIIKLINGTYE